MSVETKISLFLHMLHFDDVKGETLNVREWFEGIFRESLRNFMCMER